MGNKRFEILDNQQKLNEHIDFFARKNIIIDVKICQEKVKSGNSDFPKRLGRFSFDIDRHKYLIQNKGFYLFLVKNNGFIVAGKLCLAENIKYSKWVIWKNVVN